MQRLALTIGGLAFAAVACASKPPPVEPVADLVIPPMPSSKPEPPPSNARRPPPPAPRAVPEPAEPDPFTLSAQPSLPGAGMAVPSPVALPCKSDAECMTHRCNPSYGKCAFPCQSDVDCIPGATCFTAGGAMAACLPKPP